MRKKKGEYGYRNYQKLIQFGEVLFGAAMIIVQLLARNWTDNRAAKNVLTLMAILSVLPTANVASPFLATLRFWTPGEEFHRKILPFEQTGLILYDLIVTTKEQILPFDAMMVHPRGICAYCTNGKADVKKAEKTLNEAFKANNLDPNLKIVTDEKVFLSRLGALKPASEYGDNAGAEDAASLLRSMSM